MGSPINFVHMKRSESVFPVSETELYMLLWGWWPQRRGVIERIVRSSCGGGAKQPSTANPDEANDINPHEQE